MVRALSYRHRLYFANCDGEEAQRASSHSGPGDNEGGFEAQGLRLLAVSGEGQSQGCACYAGSVNWSIQLVADTQNSAGPKGEKVHVFDECGCRGLQGGKEPHRVVVCPQAPAFREVTEWEFCLYVLQ